MRIAIDARYLNRTPSALGQYCENFLEHLSEADKENDYIVFTHASYPKTLRLGENFEIEPVRGEPVSWRGLFTFQTRVEKHRPDALHALYPIMPFRSRAPLIVTAHDLKPFLLRDTGERGFFLRRRMREAVARRVFPAALRRAKWIVAVSNATREEIHAVFPDEHQKTIVVHSGLDPAFLSPLEDATRELVLAKYQPPERYLFYCGNIRPGANLGKLITAFAYLRSSEEALGNVELLIAAPPSPYTAEIVRLVNRLRLGDAVHFHEQVTDPERRVLYERAAAFCFPCLGEGFGFPVLEAQASGTPVLAADHGALPEIAGPGALLVDPGHVPSIREGLRQILTDEALRKDLVEAGSRNVAKYSWLTTAKKIKEIYTLLM